MTFPQGDKFDCSLLESQLLKLPSKPIMDTLKLYGPNTNSLKAMVPVLRDRVIDNPDWLQVQISEAVLDVQRQTEAYLLEVFGSVENAIRYGSLFVMEETPLTMFIDEAFDRTTNEFRCVIETQVRIRPKTAEELEAEKSRVGTSEETNPSSR